MDELIERLTKATGPDQELDRAIHIALEGNTVVPQYTASIEWALTLVPNGWSVDLSMHPGNVGNHARVYNEGLTSEPSEIFHGTKPPALALCIAALKARAALELTQKEPQ